jgi:hypothetical protein
MSESPLDRIARVLEGSDEPDDALRATVAALADEQDVTWVGIAFVEGAELVLGPSSGTPDESSRSCAPVLYQDARVGELWVDGELDDALLPQIAERLAPYVLLGWDTGGETWEP